MSIDTLRRLSRLLELIPWSQGPISTPAGSAKAVDALPGVIIRTGRRSARKRKRGENALFLGGGFLDRCQHNLISGLTGGEERAAVAPLSGLRVWAAHELVA